MYADRQLVALENRKALLRARITVRRMECVMNGERIAAPLAAIDGLWLQWKRLSPWVKIVGVPAALLLARKLTRSSEGGTSKGKLAALLGVLPVVLEAWKGFQEHRAAAGTGAGAMR